MTKNEMQAYLQKRLQNCQKAQEQNAEKNKGFSGCINTESGRQKDAYLQGKIDILKDIIKILD